MKKTLSAKTWNGELGEDGYAEIRPSLFWALITGFLFWVGLIGILLFVGISAVQAEEPVISSTNDPMVMKIYPDGTKAVALS